MLLKVLDELKIQLCVGIGDGAGANILARFGLAHPERILGLVLINLVSLGVGFLESIKEKFFSKRRSSQQLCPEEIVTMHKVIIILCCLCEMNEKKGIEFLKINFQII